MALENGVCIIYKYVSVQQAYCETQGGKYNLHWNSAYNSYQESCYIEEKQINLPDNLSK